MDVQPISAPAAAHDSATASNWIIRHAGLVPRPGPVLDLAAGSGRHARYFKGLGYDITALDRDVSRMADLATVPGGRDRIEVIEADLETGSGDWPLGDRTFAGIVVTNYLHRPILPRIAAALGPGGGLIDETFGAGNERFGKPSNPDFLLRPGELLRFAEAQGLTALGYFCGEVATPRKAMRQSVVARRPAGLRWN